jgi:hypothetical protein
MIKKFIMTIVLGANLFAGFISSEQYENIISMQKAVDRVVKKNAQFKKFVPYIMGIYLRESSLGLKLISDDNAPKYYYIHNNKKVYISYKYFKQERIAYENSYGHYIYYKNWQKRVYIENDGDVKRIAECSLGGLMLTIPTIKRVIKHYKIKSLMHYVEDNHYLMDLVNNLLINKDLSVYITFLYMNMNYKEAIRRGYSYPIMRAISMHNGGWNNLSYYHKVKKDMSYVEEALKEYNK